MGDLRPIDFYAENSVWKILHRLCGIISTTLTQDVVNCEK